MNKNEVMSKVDHTLLTQTATWEEIERICSQAMKYQTASVCIPPSYVKRAAQYLGGRIKVCTVIGFPNGYQTTNVKMAETKDAIQNGADEIDMVINIGDVKNAEFHKIEEEITDFIKTSTGFSTAGATFDDIKLFKAYVEPHVKIKAAGGISSFEDAEKFIELGADRLGTSRLVKILESGKNN